MTHTLIICSEKGGVGKTTLAILLAMAAARSGLTVTAGDLDPRATLTKVLRADFTPGYSLDAVYAADNPRGWAHELQVHSEWHPNLRVLPAERALGIREKNPPDLAEQRLKMALEDIDADVVILDLPPRPAGLLVTSALLIDDADVLFAGMLNQDGLDGVAEGWTTMHKVGATNPSLDVAGIALTDVDLRDGRPYPVDQRRCLDAFGEIYPGYLLEPYIPRGVGVPEARGAHDWVGHYANGQKQAAAAEALWDTVWNRITNRQQ